jgi:hypothetical protein
LSVRVIAVEDTSTLEPATAILRRTAGRRTELLQWWGGYAWEAIEEAVPIETALDDPRYLRVDLELPDD